MLSPLTGTSQVKSDTTYFSKKVKKIECKIVSNKTVALADSNIAIIKGQVFDNESKGILSELFVKSLLSNYLRSFETDDEGNFSFSIPGEPCSLTFEQSGYGGYSSELDHFIPRQIDH